MASVVKDSFCDDNLDNCSFDNCSVFLAYCSQATPPQALNPKHPKPRRPRYSKNTLSIPKLKMKSPFLEGILLTCVSCPLQAAEASNILSTAIYCLQQYTVYNNILSTAIYCLQQYTDNMSCPLQAAEASCRASRRVSDGSRVKHKRGATSARETASVEEQHLEQALKWARFV